MAVSDEMRQLLERCAILPRGLAFAHLAPIEAAAAALGVHPHAIERLRAALDRRDARGELIQAFVEACGRADEVQPGQLGPAHVTPAGPDDLIRDAERHPLGPAFLREAPLEVAAIAFAVHPDVVSAARERLLDAELGRPWRGMLAEAGVAALRTRGA